MTAVPEELGRSGKSRLGCLVAILAGITIVYYGIDLGGVYLRRWQLVQEMRSVGRLAPSLDDATIRRRLRAKAEAIDLPPSAGNFVIRRLSRPREIQISVYYDETVELLFSRYTFKISPQVRAPL